MSGRVTTLATLAIAALVVLATHSVAAAQGRGRGGGPPAGVGGGRPSGVGGGQPTSIGRPSNPGLGTASDRSRGRSDDGLGTAGRRSDGRSDAGLERAAEARRNRELRTDSRRPDDDDLAANSNRYNALASRLGYADAAAMRSAYDSVADDDVRFGEFVAAHMLARNLTRSGQLTGDETTIRSSILSRLAVGDSIGEALRGLGLSRSDAKEAERAAKRQMKESQRQ